VTGNEVARIGLMRVGAGRREAERAGSQRCFGQPPHFGDVVLCSSLAIYTAIPHHENSQRMVRDLRGDIDRARHPVERVEIFGEALPIPLQTLGERSAGNILDRLHQIDETGAVFLTNRRKADAAIAKQDRRDPMPG
jgi:hypothetical protein